MNRSCASWGGAPPDINSFSIAGFYVFLGIWLMPCTFILPEALYRFWQDTRPARK